MKRLGLIVVLMGWAGTLWSQDFSNAGKEFWIPYAYHVAMKNVSTAKLAMTLYITAQTATSYKVEIASGVIIKSGNLAAGQVDTCEIPEAYALTGEGKFLGKAVHVVADNPVIVYSYITRSSISAATICLPYQVLGKEYFSMNFTQISNETNSHSYFTIIGVEDNTTVEITPSAETLNGWLPGNTYQVLLNKGEIYQVLGKLTSFSQGFNTGVDLTGSRIVSVASGATGGCKRIAVFSGSGKVLIQAQNCTKNTSDNLYQQLYPTSSWGNNFLTAPSYNRKGNYYRIMRISSSTNVSINGTPVPSAAFINTPVASYVERYTDQPMKIQSDGPITVAQYFTTQECPASYLPYDPEMIILNPVEQNINSVTLVSSNLYSLATTLIPHQHHLQVIIKNTGTALSSFRFDGSPVSISSWTVHPADPTYSYIYLHDVAQGYHTLFSDSGFNALAYGYANTETYGYSAGANVKDKFQFLSVQNDLATINEPKACANRPFKLRITLPYAPTSIQWKFNNVFPDVNLNAPVPVSTQMVEGKMLYTYQLDLFLEIATVTTIPLTIIADNTLAPLCGGIEEIKYDLKIYKRPVSKVASPDKVCVGAPISYLDQADAFDRSVAKYLWEDNGQLVEAKDRISTYTSAGSVNVKHWVVNDLGCLSDTLIKSITVNPLPIPKFKLASNACGNRMATLNDISEPNDPNGTTSRLWTMPDGTTPNSANVNYAFPGPGDYPVKLSVTNFNGCVKDTQMNVHAYDIPNPDFKTPKICLDDRFAVFTNLSTIADNSSLQWEWNFGDSTAVSNTSTDKDPTHEYTKSKAYTVKLKVTAASTCDSTISKTFKMNGVNPKASLAVVDAANLCSNRRVTIQDASGVDFGDIVRVEIFWDQLNDLTNDSVDDNPAPGESYAIQYPKFSIPSEKTYTIRYVAYSGISCVDDTLIDVVLKASPSLQFNPLNPVCEEKAPYLLNAASETSGMGGAGVYTGKGIQQTVGLFSPAVAGPGNHLIRYTYTAVNSCIAVDSQTLKVYPQPTANAGPPRTVLEDSYIILNGSGTGNQISFLWLPPDSVDGDNTIPNPKVSPKDDFTYTLIVTSADGCADTSFVKVTVLKNLRVPNAFSPNGDGINDTWFIEHLDAYPDPVLEVFNRYGQLVYRSKGHGNPWNGTLNGNPLPVGTYYWLLNPGSGRKAMNGSVTLLR